MEYLVEKLFVAIGVGLGSGGILYAVALLNRWPRVKIWRRAAASVGLSGVSISGGPFDARLTGTHGPHGIRFEIYRREHQDSGTRIVIEGLGYGYGELILNGDNFRMLTEKFASAENEPIGNTAFVDSLFILGSIPLAFAVLDAPTRKALYPLFHGEIPCGERGLFKVEARVTIESGELRAEIPGGFFGEERERLPEALKILLAVAARLRRPDDEDIPGRLAANARSDPVPGVRLANLVALLREYPDLPLTRETLLAALEDPSDEIRLRAAVVSGKKGRATLLEIASSDRSREVLAAKAIEKLGGDLPVDRAAATLAEALGADRTKVALAAVKSLGARDDTAAEVPLIEALGRGGEVGAAAIEALGKLGTAAAVVPLREVAAADPLDIALRRAVTLAIARIQSRLPGASPGQLSLAGEGEGKLTLSDDGPGGEVSLSEGP
jgi:hypothetical protein